MKTKKIAAVSAVAGLCLALSVSIAAALSQPVYYYGNSTNAGTTRGSYDNSTAVVATDAIWLARGGIAWFNGTSGYNGESGSFNATIQIKPDGQSAWITVDTTDDSVISVDNETKSVKINAGGIYRILVNPSDIDTGFAEVGIQEILPR